MADLAYLQSDPTYVELRGLLGSGSCCAIVGSGLSQQYPSWTTLVMDVCSACGLELSERARTKVNGNGEALARLAGVAKALDDQEYVKLLRQKFSLPKPMPTDAHEALVRGPFTGFVTLNFDTLLEAALERSGVTPVSPPISALNISRLGTDTVLHLHGQIRVGDEPDPSKLVLGDDDFLRHYGSDTVAKSFLQQLFSGQHVVFIGCGLQEPEIRRLLTLAQEFRKAAAYDGDEVRPKMFALRPMPYRKGENGNVVRVKAVMGEETRAYAQIGVEVVWYENRDGSHRDLVEILQTWGGIAAPRVHPDAGDIPEGVGGHAGV